MNLLLLEPLQIQNNNEAQLSQRQIKHLMDVLKVEQETRLKVGLINGKTGSATVKRIGNTVALGDLELDQSAPAQRPTTLILALPRPQMIKRILQTIACMGVQKLYLIQTAKVEKSFWQSPSLSDEAIREHLILGLEQAGATQLPGIEKFQRFRPFAEDVLPKITQGKTPLIAHPGAFAPCPQLDNEDSVVAIGPEGGFTENEVAYFVNAGFAPFQLGQRILKVEVAVPVILARLHP